MVDEAWLLLQHQDGGRFLENIVRLARSYGMGLVFITQDVKNVLSDPRGSVIADNVFSTLLLRQSGKSQQQTTQTQQLVAEQFGLSTEEQRRLSSALPGHGLLLVALARPSARDRKQSRGTGGHDRPARTPGAGRDGRRWRWRMSSAATHPGQPHADIAEVKLAYPLLDVASEPACA